MTWRERILDGFLWTFPAALFALFALAAGGQMLGIEGFSVQLPEKAAIEMFLPEKCEK